MFEKLFKIKKPHESKDVLRSEHLKEGISPIVACVGTPEQFRDNPGDEQRVLIIGGIEEEKAPLNINYYGEQDALVKRGMKNAGKFSYVMSPIDAADKISRRFINCTGLVVAGKDKRTGENVSLVTHQDPHYFLVTESRKSIFVHDLEQKLREIKERCEEGTIDAVIVGGNSDSGGYYKDSYVNSIKLLSEETQNVLGFEPVVMTGPKAVSPVLDWAAQDDVFYDNAHRRLFIIRPKVGDASTESFVYSTLKEQKKKW
ncbi:MAG: hypothetical protein AAB727_02965 [Patescibacteria group bacterium]